MSFDLDTLYNALPALYRVRDAAEGGPLRDLLAIVAEEVAAIEEDLAQLYDDQFIETCAEWVVPYIGDLVAYRLLHGETPAVASRRAEVANTIAFRRRKGTAAVLEQLARDVTGWEAAIVEFFQRLARTAHVNHVRPETPALTDTRPPAVPTATAGAFDRRPRSIDVRRIASGRGRHNIPNVGVFLWRLGSHPLTGAPAVPIDPRRFSVSPLGHDVPLFNRPAPQGTIEQLAGPVNAPIPIARRAMRDRLSDYYGPGASVAVSVGGETVPIERVSVCDLSDLSDDPETSAWAHMPADTTAADPPRLDVAIDPELGRLAFSRDVDSAATPVRASFRYGFGADLGGGEYTRAASLAVDLRPLAVVPGGQPDMAAALAAIGGTGAVEIGDSGRYAAAPAAMCPANGRLEIRAADEARPVVDVDGEWLVGGGDSAEVSINGLLVTGGPIRVPATILGQPNRLQRLRIAHCTLVPGRALTRAGQPAHPETPSLIVDAPDTIVEIDRSIVGALRIAGSARVAVTDSVVDATADDRVAFASTDGIGAGGALSMSGSTLVGQVRTVTMSAISNSLIVARRTAADTGPPVVAERVQEGCVRFSYVPLDARVPRRYRCQPAGAAGEAGPRPLFTSMRYGDAGYMQLLLRASPAIRTGADDESEMGAFHFLRAPQRESDLRVRVEEYLRLGLEAGLLFES